MNEFRNLVGQIYNGAKVLEFIGKNKSGTPKWKCRCSCGKEFVANTTQLLKLQKTNCFSPNHDKIVGKKFGKLIATSDFILDKGHRKFLCNCDCGNITYVDSYHLLSGHTKSCGCLMKEGTNKSNYRHGMTNTRIHRIWSTIIGRIKYKSHTSYRNYGGRGISVCSEWEVFENFYKWSMENGYRDDLTIDRIDVNGNYEPSNCRWITYKEQANNTRTNKYIEYNGEEKTISEWADYAGIPYKTFYYRYKTYGWSIEDCINTPINGRKKNKKAVEK